MKGLTILFFCLLGWGGLTGIAAEISTEEQYRMIKESAALVYASRDARFKQGDLKLAESQLLQALALIEKAMGPEHEHVAVTLSDLASLYKDAGRIPEARDLYARALRIKENKFGADHPETVSTAMNLGGLYHSQGQFEKAEPLLEKAVRLFRAHLGADHPNTAVAVNNLGGLYREMGRNEEAESCFKESLEIHQKAMGRDDPRTIQMMGNLATFYRVSGRLDEAAALLEESLRLLSQHAEPQKPLIARQQGQLGVIHLARGDFTKAEPLLLRSVEMLRELLGDEHASLATAMSDLASLYKATGRFGEALPLLEDSVRITEETSGMSHPFASRARINLATTLFDLGENERALDVTRREARAHQQMLEQMLSFTTESERLAFQAAQYQFHLAASLNASDEIAEAVLREKGIILESVLEDRRALQQAEQAGLAHRWEELNESRAHLRRSLLGNPDPKIIEDLERQVRQLDKQLSRDIVGLGTARRSLSLTVEQVQESLPGGTAVLDFFQYSHYQGKATWLPCYGVVVWRNDKAPVFLSCGPRDPVAEAIAGLRKALGNFDDESLATTSRSLHRLLIEPLASHLEGVHSLVICPDGQLSFVSFASLLDQRQRFLAETYRIGYAASARDLLKEGIGETSSGGTVLLGGADFRSLPKPTGADTDEGNPLLTANLRSAMVDDLESLELAALPGSLREIEGIASALGDDVGGRQVLLGNDASESAIRGVRSPRVLHFATHGFFLREIRIGNAAATPTSAAGIGSIAQRRIDNPMYRSGIALAGAQTTIEKWRQGEVPDPDNDGILMATEVSELDLRGTDLVTLSACSTGAGEAMSGEGVLGLRRAFVMAGTRNLLMTLWPVADEETADFMVDFYTRYTETGNAPRSLAEVQREWLVRLREEKGLVHAVNRAGAFIMNSQGRLD